MVNRFGLASFLDHFVPVLINIVTTPIIKKSSSSSTSVKEKGSIEEENDVPSVVRSPFGQLCADALLWLSQLLGPTLSTQHITHALMNQLYQCFPVSSEVVASGRYSSQHAMPAVQCLVNIVILYGEPLLLDDYIKRLLDMVSDSFHRPTLPFLGEAQFTLCSANGCLSWEPLGRGDGREKEILMLAS